MAKLTRRDVLRSSAAVTATAAIAGPVCANAPALSAAQSSGITAASEMLAPRERLLMDFGWRFHLGHAQDVTRDFGFGADQRTYAKSGGNVATAAAIDFDDNAWEAVDLPHDWAVALPFVPSTNPPPPKDDDPRAAHGYKPLGREFPETSVGWYRRAFTIPRADEGRRLSLEFDGVFRNAIVLLNGYIVGSNESGYAPFRVDITDYVNYGGKNVLAVRVDATLGEGWFYEGAGIYRHVWLVKTSPVHIPQWGVVVRAVPAGAKAMLTVLTDVASAGNSDVAMCEVRHTVTDPDGHAAAELGPAPVSVAAGDTAKLQHEIGVDGPQLWSLESPRLYKVVTEVRQGGKVVDRYATAFGIRDARFDPAKGFFLNGQRVKLKGACNHQDHAGVGSALPDRILAYRIEKMKEMGANAYRTAHNPPAPELLDACDRLGMLVIDETRTMAASAEGLSQLERMIRRDRNHPSVILWSLGNEEQPQQGTPRGARVIRDMNQLAKRLDPSRPVTAAMDHEFELGIAPELDVLGFNYRTEFIDPHHKAFPNQPIIGTETASTVCTRGIYARDEVKGFVPAYDTDAPWWATTAEAWWTFFAERDYCAGGFVWTAFDYRGEPTPFNRWPEISSHFGYMDTCGFPKDNYYYYRAWWKDEPLLHLFPHWNWENGRSVDVWCHTNLDRAELFLNGRSLGTRDVTRNRHIEWKAVPFEPGAIEARGYRNGQLVLTTKRETAGPATAIVLKPDRTAIRADGEDVSVVAVEIVDAAGRVVPLADNAVTFTITGPGRVIGVGNGNPISLEPDKASARRAFNGLCMAIVQSAKRAGPITVAASSPGLAAARVTVDARHANLRPAVA